MVNEEIPNDLVYVDQVIWPLMTTTLNGMKDSVASGAAIAPLPLTEFLLLLS